jgi:penicillin-binding protein 1A
VDSFANNNLDTDITDDTATQPRCAPRVISKQNAFLIAEAMHSAVWGGGSWTHKTGWSGTGWRAQALDRRDLSGKTGTTNDSVDTWFSGFNRNVVTSVWVGFDNPGNSLGRSTYNNNLDSSQISGAESGAKTAQPAWVDFMKVRTGSISSVPGKACDFANFIRSDFFKIRFASVREASSIFS